MKKRAIRRDRYGWWRVRLVAQNYTDPSLVRALVIAIRGLRFDVPTFVRRQLRNVEAFVVAETVSR